MTLRRSWDTSVTFVVTARKYHRLYSCRVLESGGVGQGSVVSVLVWGSWGLCSMCLLLAYNLWGSLALLLHVLFASSEYEASHWIEAHPNLVCLILMEHICKDSMSI